MNCPHCGEKVVTTRDSYKYIESGLTNVWISDCEIRKCSGCGREAPTLPEARQLTILITYALLRQRSKLDADSVLFLRKAMGLTSAALAECLEVSRGEVSRWENGRARIGDLSDFRLRYLAVKNLLPAELHQIVEREIDLIIRAKYSADPRFEPIRISTNAMTVLTSDSDPPSIDYRVTMAI